MQRILKIYPNSGQPSLNTPVCPSRKLQQTPQELRQVTRQHTRSKYQGPEEKSVELLRWAQKGTTDSSFVAISTCFSCAGAGPVDTSNDTLFAAQGTAWEAQAATQPADISSLRSVSCCIEKSFLTQTCCQQQEAPRPWWSEPDQGLSGQEAKAGPFQHSPLAAAQGQASFCSSGRESRTNSTEVNEDGPAASQPTHSCWSLSVNTDFSSSGGFLGRRKREFPALQSHNFTEVSTTFTALGRPSQVPNSTPYMATSYTIPEPRCRSGSQEQRRVTSNHSSFSLLSHQPWAEVGKISGGNKSFLGMPQLP